MVGFKSITSPYKKEVCAYIRCTYMPRLQYSANINLASIMTGGNISAVWMCLIHVSQLITYLLLKFCSAVDFSKFRGGLWELKLD